MALVILRCVFLAVAIALGFQLLSSDLLSGENRFLPYIAFFGVMFAAVGVLAADMGVKRKRLDTITAVYFGTIIGLFLTYVFQLALTPILPNAHSWLSNWLGLALATVVCYSCISILLQTKDDFRFIILSFAHQLSAFC